MQTRISRRSRIAVLGVGLAVVALALVSAGTVGATASPSTPPSPPSPRVAKTVTLTLARNGSTVLATKGERVVVALSGDHLRWSVARADPSGVLSLVSEGDTATGASTTVFRVASYGTAELTATGTPVCPRAAACAQFVVLWHATVVVPVVDPPPPAA